MLDFVVNVTQQFIVNKEYAQFALVTYNDIAMIRVNLSDYEDRESLDRKIRETPYCTGNTDTYGYAISMNLHFFMKCKICKGLQFQNIT